jgi:hypothetical protein
METGSEMDTYQLHNRKKTIKKMDFVKTFFFFLVQISLNRKNLNSAFTGLHNLCSFFIDIIIVTAIRLIFMEHIANNLALRLPCV